LSRLHLNTLTGDEGVECIADALQANTGIKELSLRYCSITSSGGTMLAASLSFCHVDTLWLGGNLLKDSGIASLADALCVNTSLRLLCLEGTGITDAGASDIYAALGENVTIATILLGCSDVGDKGVLAMIYHACLQNSITTEWEATEKDYMYYIKRNEHEKEIRLPEDELF